MSNINENTSKVVDTTIQALSNVLKTIPDKNLAEYLSGALNIEGFINMPSLLVVDSKPFLTVKDYEEFIEKEFTGLENISLLTDIQPIDSQNMHSEKDYSITITCTEYSSSVLESMKNMFLENSIETGLVEQLKNGDSYNFPEMPPYPKTK